MNQVEIWFGTLNRRLLRWGSFTSVEDLEDSIRRFVAQYNDVWAHPYKWTYNSVPDRPEGTLVEAKRDRTEKAEKDDTEESVEAKAEEKGNVNAKTEAANGDEQPGEAA
jgi:hypothetical protein